MREMPKLEWDMIIEWPDGPSGRTVVRQPRENEMSKKVKFCTLCGVGLDDSERAYEGKLRCCSSKICIGRCCKKKALAYYKTLGECGAAVGRLHAVHCNEREVESLCEPSRMREMIEKMEKEGAPSGGWVIIVSMNDAEEVSAGLADTNGVDVPIDGVALGSVEGVPVVARWDHDDYSAIVMKMEYLNGVDDAIVN